MKNQDKPSFPISEESTARVDEGVRIYYGLTKLEHFAGLAMQGLLANSNEEVNNLMEKQVAEVSLSYAKALLTELEKE